MAKRKAKPETTLEGWEQVAVDKREYLGDGAGMSDFGNLAAYQVSLPSDHKDGDNPPVWQTEQQHQAIRAAARVLAETDEVAIGALDNLANYIVGEGFRYDFAPVCEDDEDLASVCSAAWSKFATQNNFDESVQRELFCNSRRDGEFFLGLFARGKKIKMRVIDPSFITEPADVASLEDYIGQVGLNWKYGVATTPNDMTDVAGYFCSWYGDANDWDFVPVEEMVHLKLNVDRDVKRGLSDFFATGANMERAERLLGNTMQGAAVQASIAYIREHAEGTSPDAIRSFTSSRADNSITDPVTGKQRKTRAAKPGTVVDIPNGMKYHNGPLGASNATTYVDIIQAGLRRVGLRWTMPEYMISGDASNGNFASTLVAESPFTKAAQSRQRVYVRAFRDLAWKVFGMLIRAGVFSQFDIETVDDLQERITVQITPSQIAVRDRTEDHTIRKEQYEAGLISKQTWASQENVDLEAEQAIRKQEAAQGIGGLGTLGAGLPTATPTAAATPDANAVDVAATALNGAQIASLLQVIDAVSRRMLPLESARSVILASFPMLSPDVVAKMLAPLATFTPPPPALPVAEHWKGYP